MMSREEVEKSINETQRGICSECGEKAGHYLKIDNGMWVSYNICDCGRMFNFTRRYLSPTQEFDYKMDLMKNFMFGLPHLRKLHPL